MTFITTHIYIKKKQIKHQLLEPDYPRRRVFSAWLQSRRPRFVENLVMTDETAFAMNGTVNSQNTRHWSEHRPEGNVFETSLRRGKFSVWAGICVNGAVIGPPSSMMVPSMVTRTTICYKRT